MPVTGHRRPYVRSPRLVPAPTIFGWPSLRQAGARGCRSIAADHDEGCDRVGCRGSVIGPEAAALQFRNIAVRAKSFFCNPNRLLGPFWPAFFAPPARHAICFSSETTYRNSGKPPFLTP